MIALQQNGNGHFIGWAMTFSCAVPKVVTELQKIANRMEKILEDWKRVINEQRDRFYELNYYTTQQLLMLCEELGRMRSPQFKDEPKMEVMALIQSISRELTPQAVVRHLQHLDDAIRDYSDASYKRPYIASEQGKLATGVSHQVTPGNGSDIKENEEVTSLQDKRKEKLVADIVQDYGFPKALVELVYDENCEESDESIGDVMLEQCTIQATEFQEKTEEDTAAIHELFVTTAAYFNDELEERLDTGFTRNQSDAAATVYEMHHNPELPIDEHHPVVKELLILDYSLDQCLEAAEKYPKDIVAALEYLMITKIGTSVVYEECSSSEQPTPRTLSSYAQKR